MQFKGHWITDGLIESKNLLIGRNMIRNFTKTIREAKAKAQVKQKAETRKTKAAQDNVPQPKANKARENRITMEIVVDAYNEQERAMGWYCYLEEKLQFPFTAKCINVRTISPIEIVDEVEVRGMAASSECEHEMFVEIRREKRNLAVPLSQLKLIDGDDETRKQWLFGTTGLGEVTASKVISLFNSSVTAKRILSQDQPQHVSKP